MEEKIPEIINPIVKLEYPNQPIEIYHGTFFIKHNKTNYEVTGKIYYHWLPSPRIRFEGTGNFPPFSLFEDSVEIIIANFKIKHGLAFVTSPGSSNISGIVNPPFIIIQVDELADYIYFELPNFRETDGELVTNSDKKSFYRNRIIFESQEWTIIIDKHLNFKNKWEELRNQGGYHLLYTGKLTNKNKKVSQEESQEILRCFGLFLTFLNGRRCYPIFTKGFAEKKEIWTDYSPYWTDQFKEGVDSWLPQYDFTGLNDMWITFCNLYQNENDRDCIESLIHWYIEANNNSGFIEGSIVLLQNAFELLYNWQVKEKGLDINNGNAASQLRKLLDSINLTYEFPAKYNLVGAKLLKALKDIESKDRDFPGVFTYFRNGIVHSKLSKREALRELKAIDGRGIMRFAILEIGRYYLELFLLHIFGYDGSFTNRISENIFFQGKREKVPWM